MATKENNLESPKTEPVVKSENKIENVAKVAVAAANNETIKAEPEKAVISNGEIAVDLGEFSKIEILSTATGEKNKMIINTGRMSLNRNQIYKLPIKNKNLNLDTSYFVKVVNNFRSHIQILNVSEGSVSILPLVHNTIIKDGDVIGLMV